MLIVGGHAKDAGILGGSIVDHAWDRAAFGGLSGEPAVEAVTDPVVGAVVKDDEGRKRPRLAVVDDQVAVVVNHILVDSDAILRVAVDP